MNREMGMKKSKDEGDSSTNNVWCMVRAPN